MLLHTYTHSPGIRRKNRFLCVMFPAEKCVSELLFFNISCYCRISVPLLYTILCAGGAQFIYTSVYSNIVQPACSRRKVKCVLIGVGNAGWQWLSWAPAIIQFCGLHAALFQPPSLFFTRVNILHHWIRTYRHDMLDYMNKPNLFIIILFSYRQIGIL